VAAVGKAAAIGSDLSIVYALNEPAEESLQRWGSALALATPSGRVAVLVDKSTKDVDAFDASNLRQAGWDFGPAFIKICAYFPYPGKIWFNGHEWAKRQAAKAGIGFRELSNGFASTTDPGSRQSRGDVHLGLFGVDAPALVLAGRA
jgi:hypothetical protein